MRNDLNKRKGRVGYFFILPFFIIFILFEIYPLVFTFVMSLHRWDLISKPISIGFKNYLRLVKDPIFYQAVGNTVLIWSMNIIPRLGLALFFAYHLSKEPAIKGKQFFMAVFYLPNLITATSVAALYKVLLDWRTGPVNHLLLKLGLVSEPINFFQSIAYTRFFTAFTIGWMWFGYAMLLFIAGMGAISKDLYESARIDGASDTVCFFRITLPQIRPTLAFVLITSMIGGLQNFDIPRVLTDGLGSPEKSILTVVMYLYNQSFGNFQLGYGSAIAYGLFIIIMLVSIPSFKSVYGKGSEL